MEHAVATGVFGERERSADQGPLRGDARREQTAAMRGQQEMERERRRSRNGLWFLVFAIQETGGAAGLGDQQGGRRERRWGGRAAITTTTAQQRLRNRTRLSHGEKEGAASGCESKVQSADGSQRRKRGNTLPSTAHTHTCT